MNIKKLFAIKRPCPNCPFLKTGGIHLAPGRLDSIKKDLLSSDEKVFFCHKTTYLDGAEDTEHRGEGTQYQTSGKEAYCMGAMAWLYINGQPNIAVRLGSLFNYITDEDLKTSIDMVNPVSPN